MRKHEKLVIPRFFWPVLLVALALSGVWFLTAGARVAAEAPDGPPDPAGASRGQPAFLTQSPAGLEEAETATYIVVLKDEPLARYRGGLPQFDATNPDERGEERLDPRSPASRAYLAHLAEQRLQARLAAEQLLARPLEVKYEYGATLVGYAAEMTAAEAAAVAALPDVLFVEKEQIERLHTDAGPGWISAPDLWGGIGSFPATKGEGIVIAIIDSGIDPWNPSFADIAGDGYDHNKPAGVSSFIGHCNPVTFPCNDKLIGAWDFIGGENRPIDRNGHGSHTAATAAGNELFDVQIETPTGTFVRDLSGVAPRANLIIYQACTDDGLCPSSATQAARDRILLDGVVDVVNYSIGSSSPTVNPWSSVQSLSWLAIREAGIFVATSAGNSGPTGETVGNPADLPWITSVGASSHDRLFQTTLTLTDTNGSSLTLQGQGLTTGTVTARVVFAEDATPGGGNTSNYRLCFDDVSSPATFSGEIVICERGINNRIEKGENVRDGGGNGLILAEGNIAFSGPGSVTADPHVIPATHLTYDQYQQLRSFFSSAPGQIVTGTISAAEPVLDSSAADILATFSSRGPNRTYGDWLVPNLAAPGRSIVAAHKQGIGGNGDFTYASLDGTSMASPHVAGSAALLRALHPGWTVQEIASALMLTAAGPIATEDGTTPADPFDQGSGRVDLAAAVQSGLIMDISIPSFESLNPSAGNLDPGELNAPFLAESFCIDVCTWTRTVKNGQAAAATWQTSFSGPPGFSGTVTPANFTLNPGQSQVLQIEVDVSSFPKDSAWVFGTLTLTPSGGSPPPPARMPIAVYPANPVLPERVKIETTAKSGAQIVPDLRTPEITNLTIRRFGLTKSTIHDFARLEDLTVPFDNLSEIYYTTVTVPAGAKRIVAEILETTADDVDLYIGTGSTPITETVIAQGISTAALEYLSVDLPAAGTYWILAQNAASGPDPETADTIKMATAVVPGSAAGNFQVAGPASVAPGQPFDLTVTWNEATLAYQVPWYGAFDIGPAPGSPGQYGQIAVDLYYLGAPALSVNPTSISKEFGSQEISGTIDTAVALQNTGDGLLSWDADTPPKGSEALVDGGFEAGSWSFSSSIGQTPLCTTLSCGFDLARTGSGYVWFGGWGQTNTAVISQTRTIPAGDTALLTFYLLIGADSPTDSGQITVQIDGQTLFTASQADAAAYTSYQAVSLDVSAFADGQPHTIRFIGQENGSSVINFFVDDATLTTIPSGEECRPVSSISWLEVTPENGTLGPGENGNITLAIVKSKVPVGTSSATVCLTSNSPTTPNRSVAVTVKHNGSLFLPIIRR